MRRDLYRQLTVYTLFIKECQLSLVGMPPSIMHLPQAIINMSYCLQSETRSSSEQTLDSPRM